MLNKLNLEEVNDILSHHYHTDDIFPRSCGSVSMALALMFENSELKNDYDIKYQRGHFRNDNEDCYCDIEEDDFKRCYNLDDFECLNCTCDYMTGHSWIELTDKKTNKVTILDFTSIQFEENFCDYHSELLESDFKLSKEELYDYLYKRSKFVIEENE